MLRVFICHAFNDTEIAKELGAILRNNNIDTFIDSENILVGTNFINEINFALENCNIFILLWSYSAKNSDFVKDEWTAAKRMNKKIIPCILDDTKLPGILSTLHYIDLRKLNQGLNELIKFLPLINIKNLEQSYY